MRAVEGDCVVVIEDDDGIRELIGAVLSQLGLEVIAVSNGLDGVAQVEARHPVLVTVDVTMPGIDGFETAKRIRAISNAYIIMLTARDEEIDALQGLGAGADDYVLKPFRSRELRARAEAMLRRPRVVERPVTGSIEVSFEGTADEAPPAERPSTGSGVLRHNGVVLNSDTHIVERDGDELDLTRSEFELLQALLTSGRSVRSKDELARLLRGDGYVLNPYVGDADRRGVEVHIGNLRKKLADNATSPYLIETVRGVGYRLAARRDRG
ncbi:response regulator transcription factor [Humibacter albus]|uniref:response regulator transcription factor n=1 Tax=Humibacter albus TaxID=427754 RepID=UPI0003B4BACF|nr:response regulator transcription factor [Humibacter albus]